MGRRQRTQAHTAQASGLIIQVLGLSLLGFYWPVMGESVSQIQAADHELGDKVLVYGRVNATAYIPWLKATVVELEDGGFRFSLPKNHTYNIQPGDRIYSEIILDKGPSLGWSGGHADHMEDMELVFGLVTLTGCFILMGGLFLQRAKLTTNKKKKRKKNKRGKPAKIQEKKKAKLAKNQENKRVKSAKIQEKKKAKSAKKTSKTHKNKVELEPEVTGDEADIEAEASENVITPEVKTLAEEGEPEMEANEAEPEEKPVVKEMVPEIETSEDI